MPKVWEAAGIATAASGSTIPSAFSARPPNVCDDKMACTADMGLDAVPWSGSSLKMISMTGVFQPLY